MDRRRVLILAAAACVAASCGQSLPVAREGTPKAEQRDWVDVPYPPPAAEVDVIPPVVEPGAVWVDGEWSPQGKRWVWVPGGWVLPPEKDAYFARWTIGIRPEDGAIRFSPGSWHAPDGARLPKPRVILGAQSGVTSSARP
jgi:hypothetical protein